MSERPHIHGLGQYKAGTGWRPAGNPVSVFASALEASRNPGEQLSGITVTALCGTVIFCISAHVRHGLVYRLRYVQVRLGCLWQI